MIIGEGEVNRLRRLTNRLNSLLAPVLPYGPHKEIVLAMTELRDELDKLIAQGVIPEALRFQAECKRVWEKMFGEIGKAAVKGASQAAFAGLALSYFTGLSWLDLFVKGCAVAAPLVVPPVLDYRRESKEIRRQNALSYLLDFRAAR